MSCAHEHDHSGYGHGGGDANHGNSHEVPTEAGPSDSLYSQIDSTHVEALNADGGGDAGQKVFKWVS